MIKPLRIGIAAGIVSGVAVFFGTLISLYNNYGDTYLGLLSSVYPGYEVSPAGSIIGMIWGFIWTFVFFFFTFWIYNRMEKKGRK